ncbi:MAG: hypothetical protein IKT58_06165 [Oscillospiraceae bacterium]|nr:hypothetical protein [Oscillospiraceae bacterium]
MLLTVIPALLSLCAIGLVLCAMMETIFTAAPENVYHIIPLEGNGAQAEQLVRNCLHTLRGKLYFVDFGLDAEGQMVVALLLRNSEYAVLCARDQILEELRGSLHCGSGTD